MSNTERQLRAQLAAAQETVKALSKRMQQLECGDHQLPLQEQLRSYQQRIQEKTQALEDSQNWNKLIVNSAMDAIIRLDQNTRIQSWNPMAEHMFGYKKDEVMGRLLGNVLLPEDSTTAPLADFSHRLSQGKIAPTNQRIEAMGHCKDDTKLPVEFTISAIRQGIRQCFVIVFHDISERKLAEQALRDANAHLERKVTERTCEVRHLAAIIEATINFVGIAELQGKIVYINPAGRKMMGLAQDRTLDLLKFKDFHSPETVRLLTEEIIPNMLAQGVFEANCDFIDISGTTIPTACIFMSLTDEQGQASRLAVIARDLREEIALQQRIEHGQRLESLGVLAGGIAHDFNNIITAILGNAAMAERKALANHQGDTQRHLSNIVASSEKAAELCKQMLAYSGKGKFVVKAINLSALVEDITQLLEISISKNVVLKYHLPENLPAVEADAAQIQQVIMNLVINASDAIGGKSGVISIVTGVMQADARYLAETCLDDALPEGRYVYLEICDTGCGMDKKTQAKIFEPFFTTKFTGHGLGMSAVLGIVRGHHGAINLYSEPGKGSTFKVLLQRSDRRVDTTALATIPVTNMQHSGTILIVDDEETIREIAAMMLEEMGFDTLTAMDGLDGLAVYRRHQKSIIAVLLDMTMPRMDGKACFTELRRINPAVKVILSSGYNEQEATSQFTGKGLAGFIQKPYLPDALAEKIQAILDG